MSPYLAIIKDSFREALASRVLWTLLCVITLLLIALLPLHWVTTVAAELSDGDVGNVRTISTALQLGAEDEASPLQKHLWNSLSKRTRERIEQRDSGRGPDFHIRDRIVKDLNAAIEKDDFYDEELWSEVTLSKRAKELQDRTLKGDQLQQFNRLALEAAMPGRIRPCPDEAVRFRYANWDLELPSLRRRDAVSMIEVGVVAFMGFVVGFLRIFSGVLVTAPIIPNMLNSGSLYVLLSKPIARPLLLISKFIGGCSYVAINATYLIIGICLILGLRFGIWKPQILWSIPLFLFTFAIFYSVSALCGLVWRSAIMAIVATIFFWFLCFAVGKTKDVIELFVMMPNKVTAVVPRGDQVFVTRANGQIGVWDSESNTLLDALANPSPRKRRGPEMMMGPRSNVTGILYDDANDQLMMLESTWSQSNVSVGNQANGWRREKTVKAKRNSKALFLHNGVPAVVADGGVFPVELDATKTEPKKGGTIFGIINIPALPTAGEEEKPEEERFSGDLGPLPTDARVAHDASSNTIYVYGEDKLRVWSLDEENLFQQTKEIELDISKVSHLKAAGGIVVVESFHSRQAEPENENDTEVAAPAASEPKFSVGLRIYDQSLELKGEVTTNNDNELSQLEVSHDGKFAAFLFEDDKLEVFDLSESSKRVPVDRGTVTGIGFDENALLVSDAGDQITKYTLPEFKSTEKITPTLPIVKRVYRYAIRPIYLVFPKPAELQNTMQYLFTGKDTVEINNGQGTTVKLNPWQPVISNSIFIGVMLLIGCVYVFRQDF